MKKLLIVLILVTLSGCATYNRYPCSEILQTMNALHCEDAMILGYTAAYMGKDGWRELVDSYQKAKQKSPYGDACSRWSGRWIGRHMWETESLWK